MKTSTGAGPVAGGRERCRCARSPSDPPRHRALHRRQSGCGRIRSWRESATRYCGNSGTLARLSNCASSVAWSYSRKYLLAHRVPVLSLYVDRGELTAPACYRRRPRRLAHDAERPSGKSAAFARTLNWPVEPGRRFSNCQRIRQLCLINPPPRALSGSARRWWAGQLAGWLLTALVLVYAIWFFGFATVHEGPAGLAARARTLASDRPFGDLQADGRRPGAAPARLVGRTGIGKPTTWMMAEHAPGHCAAKAGPSIFTEKNVTRGEAALLNSNGRRDPVGALRRRPAPLEARRALPGFALDIPGRLE